MITKEHHKQIKQEVKKIFTKSKGSHDFDHTIRVYNLCLHIGKQEDADLNILKIASLLHDIGREHQDNSLGKTCHAEKGARLAHDLLKKHHFPAVKTQAIIHCIESHRFRGTKQPLSKEAKVLFDADKLDSIGAVGIGRAFLFAGEIGAKLHDKHVDIHKTKSYSKDDTAYREFLVKLQKVKKRMLTKEGKRLAENRHQFMIHFFEQLNKEVDGIL